MKKPMKGYKGGGKVKGPPAKVRKGKAYRKGGLVTSSLRPTNQSTGTARGGGAATRGTSFRM